MKSLNYLIIIFIVLSLTSCSMVSDPIKKVGLGGRVVNYQGDDAVDSLIIPPDLTKPNSQGMFAENVEVDEDLSLIHI